MTQAVILDGSYGTKSTVYRQDIIADVDRSESIQASNMHRTTPNDDSCGHQRSPNNTHAQASAPNNYTIPTKYLCLLVLLRGLQAYSLSTAFCPDEWYQALEIAHVVVYNRGYITWEWISHIRGFAHPFLYVPVFYTLKVLQLDTPQALVVVPRVLQGIVEVTCDLALYRLTYRIFGREAARMALFCSAMSWSMWYLSSRTLSNSVEMIFTTVALDLWHWPGSDVKPDDRRSFKSALLMAACSCVVRPTSALLWIALGTYQLWFTQHRFALMLDVLIVGVPILVLSVGLDSYMYGEPVIVPWNFIRENILHGVAGFYGTSPTHWYLSSAIPTLLATHLHLFLLGVISAWKSHRRGPLLCIMWVVLVHSLLDHKEFRFIAPILPLMHMHCGVGLQVTREYLLPPAVVATVTYTTGNPETRTKAASSTLARTGEVGLRKRLRGGGNVQYHTYEKPAQVSSDSKRLSRRAKARNVRCYQCAYWAVVVIMAITQLLAGSYFAFVHQRGTLDVVTTLRAEYESWGQHQTGTQTHPGVDLAAFCAACKRSKSDKHTFSREELKRCSSACKGAEDSTDDAVTSADDRADDQTESGLGEVITFKADGACDRANVRVHVWMPCHSTPYFSHMHHDVAMRFLTCPPYTAFVDMVAAAETLITDTDDGHRERMRTLEKDKAIGADTYVDEADRFFADPKAFIKAHYGSRHGKLDPNTLDITCGNSSGDNSSDRAHSTDFANVCLAEPDKWGGWPTHIVMFDTLLPQVQEVLSAQDYELAHSLFHTHLPEGRVGTRVLVFRQISLRNCTVKSNDYIQT